MLSLKQKTDFIKTCVLGRDLPCEILNLLANDFEAEILHKKSEIISYQEKSDSLYLVYSGIVKLIRDVNGKEIVFRFLKTGDCFGDLSVLCANHNLFCKYAVSAVILLRIDSTLFLARTKQFPQLLFNIIYKYSQEIDQLAYLINIYNCSLPKDKFIFLISELYRLSGYQQNGRVVIDNCLTQQEMAVFCGMERTTLFREIKKQEKIGCLVQDKHRWEISGELLHNLKLEQAW